LINGLTLRFGSHLGKCAGSHTAMELTAGIGPRIDNRLQDRTRGFPGRLAGFTIGLRPAYLADVRDDTWAINERDRNSSNLEAWLDKRRAN
jgi:hypothetical protein